MGDLDQALGLAGQFARHEHARGITIPAIDDHRHVDVQDVTVLDLLVARNAVADTWFSEMQLACL